MRRYRTGKRIVKQGDNGTKFFLIHQGSVSCILHEQNGDLKTSKEIAKIRKGGYFGEGALLTGGKRSCDVYALTKTKVYTLERASFLHIAKSIYHKLDFQWAVNQLKSAAALKSSSLDLATPVGNMPGSKPSSRPSSSERRLAPSRRGSVISWTSAL